MFRSEDLTVNVFGQELKASNLGEEDGKYSLRNGHLRRRDFEGQLEKWMSLCVLFVWLENMDEQRVNHGQEQADLESSPWPMDGSMFIPSFKKPSCITKKPKNLVDVDYNLPENVSCKPSEANARRCWMIEIIESKEPMFVHITMQICKTMTAVW